MRSGGALKGDSEKRRKTDLGAPCHDAGVHAVLHTTPEKCGELSWNWGKGAMRCAIFDLRRPPASSASRSRPRPTDPATTAALLALIWQRSQENMCCFTDICRMLLPISKPHHPHFPAPRLCLHRLWQTAPSEHQCCCCSPLACSRSNRVLDSPLRAASSLITVGGSCRWSPASTARRPLSSAAQQAGSSAC